MARILAIDYGKKRTGLAVTDPMQIIANGLTTVATSELEAYILDYASREELECIVVGKPTQNSGEVSENMRRIEPFVNRLQKLLPHIPVEYCDERFTSLLAHQAMLDGGLHKKERQNKALVDEISATIILQSYMDARRITAARRNEEKMSE
jgi:putative Holliday junction resolvase